LEGPTSEVRLLASPLVGEAGQPTGEPG